MTHLLQPVLALEGDWADLRAVAVVVIALVMLVGSIYMLLASNLGARVGYLVLMVSLMGFVMILSVIWLVGVPGTLPGTGPRTHEPTWVPFTQDSDVADKYRAAVDTFPQGWDAPGRVYPGNVSSGGEVDKVDPILRASLARLAAAQGLKAIKDTDWEFRLAGVEPATEDEAKLPAATVRFLQKNTPLLYGVTIPAAGKHREITVFAYRDRGKVFLDALWFFLAALGAFVVHLWLLARTERTARPIDEVAETPA